jgi:putative phage-type endonuclease
MRILDTGLQGSFEWLAARSKTFGASEASAMLGMSSYKTRDQLLHEKVTGITPDVDPATQERFNKGHAIEAAMRPVAEEIIGEELFPASGAHDDYDRITASFDGLTMLGDTAWECKTLNQKLREWLKKNIIPEEYRPQLEQQLMVSGADRALFMAALDENDYLTCWYESNADLRERILAGWNQFEIDMESYVPAEHVIAVVGAPVLDLPSITYRLNGLALQSNLADYKAAALKLVEDSKLPLENDQDFADRETLCKSFKSAEDKLKNIREQVVGEVQDIDKFCKEVDQIGELIRQARLAGEKQITARKDAIRLEIATSAANEFRDHIAEISKTIAPLQLPVISSDFAGAMKGKRTIDSLRGACNDLLAQKKIEVNALAQKIAVNQKTLREMAQDHGFLFADAQQLSLKENDDLIAVIQNRINEHNAKEQAKVEAQAEAERSRIRAEEQAKAQAEADAKLAEAERIRKAEEAERVASAPVTPETPPAQTSGASMRASQEKTGVARHIDSVITANNKTQPKLLEINRESIIDLVSSYYDIERCEAEARLFELFGAQVAA